MRAGGLALCGIGGRALRGRGLRNLVNRLSHMASCSANTVPYGLAASAF